MTPVWEVRSLHGTMTLQHPVTGRLLTTSGGWVAVDTTWKADHPVGPFTSKKACVAWVKAQSPT